MSNESNFNNAVILITREGMGTVASDANASLALKLLGTYLRLLVENKTLPAAICFYTDGVKLVVEGSALLEQLSILEQNGVRLVVCSTCLNYFGLTDKLRIGIVGGMPDIIEAQIKADKVITL